MGLGYLDFTVGQVPTAAQFDGYLMRQTVMSFASAAARDSALSGVLAENMIAALSDSDTLTRYTGAAWEILSEPPQSWTPVITQGVTVTQSATTAWYQRSRGAFHAQAFMQCSSTGTAANTITVSTPVTLANLEYVGGSALVYDSSVTSMFQGYVTPSSTTVVVLSQAGATAATGIGNNPSVQLATGDQIRLTITGRYA